jgi:superoxide dismutase
MKNYASEIKIAAGASGMGFAQNMIIHNFEEQPLFRKNSFQYRALCELDGKLCIIQSKESVKYRDFVDMLMAVGVKNALYLDMGGWNHSWYRKWENSKPSYIHNNPHKYYTNWLTFYR